MSITNKDIDEIFENIKPLNFGRRVVFQKYCKSLVENGKIEQSFVDKYTTEEFLYEYYDCFYNNYKERIKLLNLRFNNYIEKNENLKDAYEKIRELCLNEREEEFERNINKFEENKIKYNKKITNNYKTFLAVVSAYATYELTKMFL